MRGAETRLRVTASFVAVSALAIGMAAGTSEVRADAVADFYKGKQVTSYVGYPPGGGYDIYGRLVSKAIVKYIPGHPGIVNMNMPGASTLTLANHLWNVAPKDGTAYGIINPSQLFDPILRHDSNVRFNPAELTLIGNATNTAQVFVAWHTSGVTSIADLKQKELILGSPGKSGDVYTSSLALKNVLGLKLRIISGYPGTPELMMALERGELSGRLWNYDSLIATKPDWIKDGTIRILAQLSQQKHPDLPNVPLATDFAANEDDKKVLQVISYSTELSRPFVAPPGIPADRVKALRDAFMAAMKDPEFIAEANKLQLGVSPTSGAEMERILKEAYALPPAMVQKVRNALVEK